MSTHAELSLLEEHASAAALVIVGTGIQWAGQTTLAAERAIRSADVVLFAVADPWAARWLRSLNARAAPLPYPRDGRARREIYREMTARIMAELTSGKKVCAVFYGSPTFLARSAHDSLRAARAAGYPASLLPGVTSLEHMAADLGIDFGEHGCQLFEANVFLSRPRRVDPSAYLVLFQVAMVGLGGAFDADRARMARGLERVARAVDGVYPARHRVLVYEAARHPLEPPKLQAHALEELPHAELGEVSTLCFPPLGSVCSDGVRSDAVSSDAFFSDAARFRSDLRPNDASASNDGE